MSLYLACLQNDWRKRRKLGSTAMGLNRRSNNCAEFAGELVCYSGSMRVAKDMILFTKWYKRGKNLMGL